MAKCFVCGRNPATKACWFFMGLVLPMIVTFGFLAWGLYFLAGL